MASPLKIGIAVVAAAVVASIAYFGYATFEPFASVAQDIDSMNKMPAEVDEVKSEIMEDGAAMAFAERYPGHVSELEETFTGEYTLRLVDGEETLEIDYRDGAAAEYRYTCTDPQGLAQSFDVDVEAKIASGQC